MQMNLSEFKDDERVGGDGSKLENGLEFLKKELEQMTYERYEKLYPGQTKPKPRYILKLGDKRYYCPGIVVKMLHTAMQNPKLSRVRIEVTGSGIDTRYNIVQIERE